MRHPPTPCPVSREQGSGREAGGPDAKGRLAAISGPSQAPSPGPVFICPPRLLTHALLTPAQAGLGPDRGGGGGPLAGCPGEATQPARGTGGGGGRVAWLGRPRHLCRGHSCDAPCWGPPSSLCSLGRGVPGRVAVCDKRMRGKGWEPARQGSLLTCLLIPAPQAASSSSPTLGWRTAPSSTATTASASCAATRGPR